MQDYTISAIEASIKEISSDNTSGAAEILRRSPAVFSEMKLEEKPSLNVEQARQLILDTCVALVGAQPNMNSLLRLASEVVSASFAQSTGHEAVKAAFDTAAAFVESATAAAHTAAMNAVHLIVDEATVLTHSRSSTVLEALIEARHAGRSFKVIATESRPMLEGRNLAQQLAVKGIHVTVIADAAAPLLIEHADAVLIGADKITPQSVVNKIGTRMIALSAREHGVPMYAICDTSKFVAADYMFNAIRDQPEASELWPDAPDGVVVINPYFESTPLDFFSSVVTERGLLASEEARALASEASIEAVLINALKSARRD